MGFPGGSVVKNLPVKQVWWLGWEDPLEKEMTTHLSGKSHGQRRLASYSSWGCKESDNSNKAGRYSWYSLFIILKQLSKRNVDLKGCTTWELWLKFYLGQMRTAAQKVASQISLRDCSKAPVGGSQYIRFWWRRSSVPWSTQFAKGFFVSHESLMSPWRDLVLL